MITKTGPFASSPAGTRRPASPHRAWFRPHIGPLWRPGTRGRASWHRSRRPAILGSGPRIATPMLMSYRTRLRQWLRDATGGGAGAEATRLLGKWVFLGLLIG